MQNVSILSNSSILSQNCRNLGKKMADLYFSYIIEDVGICSANVAKVKFVTS